MGQLEVRQHIINRLEQWAPLIDQAIASASLTHYEQLKNLPNFDWDVRCCLQESYGLIKGEDLRYDRPCTALMYDLWYKPQRITTCLPVAIDALLSESGDLNLEIYDLGAGTGAFKCVLTLVAAALCELDGNRSISLHFVNIDSSAIMLNHLQQQWKSLKNRISFPKNLKITSENSLNSYSSQASISTAVSWVTCSYLFDHSDKVDQIIEDFDKLISQFKPAKVLMSASTHKFFRVAPQMKAKLAERSYQYLETQWVKPFNGSPRKVNAARKTIFGQVQDRILLRDTSWKGTASKGAILQYTSPVLQLDAKKKDVKVEMFMKKLPDRLNIKLSPEQERLCNPGKQALAVFGPAGSGKSIVLSEHLCRLIKQNDYDHDLRILVTTFNKELVTKVLAKWLPKLLDSGRWYRNNVDDGSASIGFISKEGIRSKVANIQLFNFDKLPTRIGKVHKRAEGARNLFGTGLKAEGKSYEEHYLDFIKRAISDVKERLRDDFDTNLSSVSHVLDPYFVQDELDRVIYGQSVNSKFDYLDQNLKRPGRPVLQYNGTPRRVLWGVIEKFFELSQTENYESFLNRRILFRRQLDNRKHRGMYTHIFVDELQDCTDADYRIFFGLLRDPNNLFVTGDIAQAVHIGKSSKSALPRYDHFYDAENENELDSKQSRWRYESLDGSFRLPFRISEALISLSQSIANQRQSSQCEDDEKIGVVLQHPYKGSPPGARIIVLSADSETELAIKVSSIKDVYSSSEDKLGFEINDALIVLERDPLLCYALKQHGINAKTDSILRLKGLEFPWVIWSTRTEAPGEEDRLEYAYTILTRTSGMAIIGIVGEPNESAKSVVNTFRYEDIICWDEESKRAFDLCKQERIDSRVESISE